MNYGEELVYWYLRLNGFFPIANFVIHRSTLVEYSADCDVLAIRTPFVYEEIGGQTSDWDRDLADKLDFERRTVGVICEVKTGAYDPDKIFRSEYVRYSVGRLGLVPSEQIKGIADSLSNASIVESPDGPRIGKLLVANGDAPGAQCLFRTLGAVEDFISDRVRAYPKQKYADRMYFGSELFQHAIHRINREITSRASGDTRPGEPDIL